MRAIINGEERELDGRLTIARLLDLLGTPRNGVAVARNDRVVSRAQHETEHLEEGDRIEIIRAVAGG